MKQHKTFKEGMNVKITEIHTDHLVHTDEDSGELPNKTGIKNLKRFEGLVGVVDDVSYNNSYESYFSFSVKFSDGTIELFSEYELEDTEEDLSRSIPPEIKVVDIYLPLSEFERHQSLEIFKAFLANNDVDKILTNKKHYIEECIDLAIRLNKQQGLNWYRGTEEVEVVK